MYMFTHILLLKPFKIISCTVTGGSPEGDPFQGSLSNDFENELSEKAHVLTKQKTLLKSTLSGEQQGKGAQEDCCQCDSQSHALIAMSLAFQ